MRIFVTFVGLHQWFAIVHASSLLLTLTYTFTTLTLTCFSTTQGVTTRISLYKAMLTKLKELRIAQLHKERKENGLHKLRMGTNILSWTQLT